MIQRMRDTDHVFVRSMGKAFRLTAICTTEDEANAHMERTNLQELVIAQVGPFILLAERYGERYEVKRVD